jgi:hypothetical protein
MLTKDELKLFRQNYIPLVEKYWSIVKSIKFYKFDIKYPFIFNFMKIKKEKMEELMKLLLLQIKSNYPMFG